MNSDQVTGSLDRIATVAATWFLGIAVQRHWISSADSVAFLPIIVALPAALWGLYKNRSSAIVASASALPGVSAMTVDNKALGDAAKAADPTTNVTVKS